MNTKNKKLKVIFYTILIVLIIISAGIWLKNSEILKYMSSVDELKTYINSFGDKSYIVFFILQLLSIIIAPIPSNVSSIAGAMIFGMWEAFFITMLAIIIGSMIVFLLSRVLGRKFADKFVANDVYQKYEGLVNSKKGEIIISLMLLLPFFPDDMINFIAGMSNISFKRYMIILILTRPWGILASTAIGSSNINMPIVCWGILIVAIVLLIKYSSKIETKLIGLIKAI